MHFTWFCFCIRAFDGYEDICKRDPVMLMEMSNLHWQTLWEGMYCTPGTNICLGFHTVMLCSLCCSDKINNMLFNSAFQTENTWLTTILVTLRIKPFRPLMAVNSYTFGFELWAWIQISVMLHVAAERTGGTTIISHIWVLKDSPDVMRRMMHFCKKVIF